MQAIYPGAILLCAGNCLTSRVIAYRTCTWRQLFDGFRISHAQFVIRHDGQLCVAESTSQCDLPCMVQGRQVSGVQIHPLEQRLQNYDGRVWAINPNKYQRLTKQKERLLTSVALGLIGTPYDRVGAVVSGLKITRHFWHFRPRLHAFCSMMDIYCLRQVEINLAGGDVSGLVWPAQLWAMSQNSDLFDEPMQVK